MWRPLSRPPGEVAASGLGASPGIAPGLASQKATARSPGRQPFWPTQSHLLHPMALQWPERAERVLSTPNPNPNPPEPQSEITRHPISDCHLVVSFSITNLQGKPPPSAQQAQVDLFASEPRQPRSRRRRHVLRPCPSSSTSQPRREPAPRSNYH